MGNPKTFLSIRRVEAGYRPVAERIADFSPVEQTLNTHDRLLQASRCMDCGVPFCHWACPLGNRQPEWQDALSRSKWREAYEILASTSDFPEFTGRICPALCEKSCALKLSCDEPVTIRENEVAIIEAAWREKYITPAPIVRNGMRVGVIGSGPAGLTVANQLNRMGYEVTLFDRHEAPGGLLRFGIPNFKLEKRIIDRRTALMQEEGIRFRMNTEVDTEHLPEGFDAWCLCTGAETPRDLAVPGRELKGIHFALEFLSQQNRILEGRPIPEAERISAAGKKVLVIGGGDTGSDCIGTSVRQGATHITQIEIMPKPPVGHNPDTPWPAWPLVLKTTSSHEEGCTRRWNLATNLFTGTDGHVTGVEVEEVEWTPAPEGGRPLMRMSGRKETIEADLVLLAMGFLKPDPIQTKTGVFVAGDAQSGASLVVRAMASGRQTAARIDTYCKTLKTDR